MISQSAQKRQTAPRKPYNEPNITGNGQKLKVVDKFAYLWEALFPEQCTLMMRSLPELQKPVWLLEDSVQMSGSEMESSLTPSLKSTRLWYCQPSCMHVRPGRTIYQRHAKRLNHFHLNCLRKLLKSSGKTRFQTQRS